MSHKNNKYDAHKPLALTLNDRYGFGARIISRMLLIDHAAQVPYHTIQKWISPQKLNGLRK